MLDYEEQRKLIVVFILGLIAVGIGVIISFIIIWMPEEEKPVEFEVGKVESSGVTSSDMVKKYTDDIINLILQKDIDAIYNLMGKDYLEYAGKSKEDFYTYMEEKNILGKKLELQQHKSYQIDGYNYVYDVTLKVPQEAYSLDIVIREVAPEKYTLALNRFIDVKKDISKVTVNSVNLNITQMARFTTSVEYEYIITNNYDKKITLNDGTIYDPILLVSSSEKAKSPLITSMPLSKIVIQPNNFRSYKATFSIDSIYDYSTYQYFVLKSVSFEGITGTSNLEFKFK